MLLPILSAILGILAFPPLGVYPLGFIFLIPLFIFFIKENNFLKLLWGVFLFRIILGTGLFYFIFEPLVFILSILVFLGLPLSFFLLRRFIRKIKPTIASTQSEVACLLIALPFLWVFWDFFEAKYSFLPTFLMTAGNIFGSSPFLGLAAIGGLIGLAFFTAAINCLISFLILNFRKSELKISAISVLFIIFVISGGYSISKSEFQKNTSIYQTFPNKLKIALISSANNFDQEFNFFKHNVLSPEEKIIAETLMEKKTNLIKNELGGEKIDLMILPEDLISIESWQDIDIEAKNKFGIENSGVLIGAYRKLALGLNTNLAATLTTVQNNKRYNSTILFNRRGELADIYNKFNLTIVGEYWPFGDWRPFYYKFIKNDLLEAGQGRAIFNKEYTYQRGQEKTLQVENLVFGSAICSEIQYPWQIKKLKKMGAKFISHTATNRWATLGLKNLRELTNNLRKIEAVWLQTPILINGREEMAGIITPDGKMDLVNFENDHKNFGIFIGEVKTN